jgi:hypothetical protein
MREKYYVNIIIIKNSTKSLKKSPFQAGHLREEIRTREAARANRRALDEENRRLQLRLEGLILEPALLRKPEIDEFPGIFLQQTFIFQDF